MSALYRPFEGHRRAEVLSLLSEHPTSYEDLIRIRSAITGRPPSAVAMLALVEAEGGLKERLRDRIVPSILHHASALLRGDEPVLVLHEVGKSSRTEIPRADAAGWIAHMILGSLPLPGDDHPHLDFSLLLARTQLHELAKLRCFFEYFDRIADAPPPGHIEIERVFIPRRESAAWAEDASPLTPLTVDDAGSIEDAEGHRQVDFANAYLGGGVLSGGCVQEEIRFAVAPELLVGMILSPRMGDGEAILLRGAERFAETRGYGFSLEFGDAFDDPAARLPDGSADVELAAIDALDYRRRDPNNERTEAAMLRELAKARAGFQRDERSLPVATGNWGCGVFLGDPARKALLQWIAASAEGRAVRYFSFRDKRVGDLEGFASAARARFGTAGALWSRLRETNNVSGPPLFAALLAP